MEILAADDEVRTVMRLEAGMCVRATRVTTAPTIQRAIVGVCAIGGWFEDVLVDVGGGRSTERTAFVDGEPYPREVRVYSHACWVDAVAAAGPRPESGRCSCFGCTSFVCFLPLCDSPSR